MQRVPAITENANVQWHRILGELLAQCTTNHLMNTGECWHMEPVGEQTEDTQGVSYIINLLDTVYM